MPCHCNWIFHMAFTKHLQHLFPVHSISISRYDFLLSAKIRTYISAVAVTTISSCMLQPLVLLIWNVSEKIVFILNHFYKSYNHKQIHININEFVNKTNQNITPLLKVGKYKSFKLGIRNLGTVLCSNVILATWGVKVIYML